MYIVEQGAAVASIEGVGEVLQYGQGAAFGELALLRNRPREARAPAPPRALTKQWTGYQAVDCPVPPAKPAQDKARHAHRRQRGRGGPLLSLSVLLCSPLGRLRCMPHCPRAACASMPPPFMASRANQSKTARPPTHPRARPVVRPPCRPLTFFVLCAGTWNAPPPVAVALPVPPYRYRYRYRFISKHIFDAVLVSVW